MKLYEITAVRKEPYFRKMRVESGFMYNFYDCEKDEYQKEWIFVPDSSKRCSKLEHHESTTVGLWATDRPDLVEDPKGVMFQITGA
jgi:hypothetical protein